MLGLIEWFKNVETVPVNSNDIYYRMPRRDALYPVKQVTFAPQGEEFASVGSFLREYRYVNIVPITAYDGKFFGFILRSPEGQKKRFLTVFYQDVVLYGLDSFKNFTYRDKLILVEGVKDCEAVKVVYPYCLAYLSSFPSISAVAVIKAIASSIIIISDNDSTIKMVRKKASETGFNHFVTPKKDLGVYLEEGDLESLRLFIEAILNASV